MASFTVLIFSASSSGISMSKASSKAMTNSTVSRESAPRSSTNEALLVTSPSSTPSCSTIICLTFSSVAVAMKLSPKNRSGRPAWRLLIAQHGLLFRQLRMCFDVADCVLHGFDFFGFVVRNLQFEGFLEGHDQFHTIQRISAQVIDK